MRHNSSDSDTMGRIILENGVQCMMSRIQLTQTECAGSEPIHSTPVQPNSPVRQGQDICNTNAVPTGKEGLLSNQTYRQPINVSGIEQDAQNAWMCPRHKKDDQVELTSIVQQKEEIRTPQDINDDDWSEKRTGKTKTIQQNKTNSAEMLWDESSSQTVCIA